MNPTLGAGLLLLLGTTAFEPDRDLPLTYRVAPAADFPGWRSVEVMVENKTTAPLEGATALEVRSQMNARRATHEGPALRVEAGARGTIAFLLPPQNGGQVQLRMTTREGTAIPWSSSQHLGWSVGGGANPVTLLSDDSALAANLRTLSTRVFVRRRLESNVRLRSPAVHLVIDAGLLERASAAWADTIAAWSDHVPVTMVLVGGSSRGLSHPLFARFFGLGPGGSVPRDGVSVAVPERIDPARAVAGADQPPLLYRSTSRSRLTLLPFTPPPIRGSDGVAALESAVHGGADLRGAVNQAIPTLGNAYWNGLQGVAAVSMKHLLDRLAPKVPIQPVLVLLLAYVVSIPILFFLIARLRAEARTWILLPALSILAAGLLLAWARLGPGSENRLRGCEVEVRAADGSLRRHFVLALYAGAGHRGVMILPGAAAGPLAEYDIPGNSPSEISRAAPAADGAARVAVDLVVPPRSGTMIEAIEAIERPAASPDLPLPHAYDAATRRWSASDGRISDLPSFLSEEDHPFLAFLEAALRSGGPPARYRVGVLPTASTPLPARFRNEGFLRVVAVEERRAEEAE